MSRAAHLLRRVASQIVQVSNTVGTVGTLIEVKAGCAWAAPSLASRIQLGARGFAAASDGGSRGTGTGSVPPTSSRSVESGDQDEWGSAIITGDWDRAWEIFETTYPVEGDDMPGVLDIMALDSEAEEKAARRQRELDLQEEAAASHVRVVDHLGRSQATGKRKTSIARVWIWEGQGALGSCGGLGTRDPLLREIACRGACRTQFDPVRASIPLPIWHLLHGSLQ
uniref:Uncharacterized protein n=1 Tax=Auxenochlorella protothecoides TaxID=3075 RepID=A0A1D2AFX6_AUXPR